MAEMGRNADREIMPLGQIFITVEFECLASVEKAFFIEVSF